MSVGKHTVVSHPEIGDVAAIDHFAPGFRDYTVVSGWAESFQDMVTVTMEYEYQPQTAPRCNKQTGRPLQ